MRSKLTVLQTVKLWHTMDLRPSEIYMHMQLKMLRVLGVWPCPEDTPFCKKILFKFLFHSMLGIKFCTLIAVSCHVYNEWRDMPDPFGTILIISAHFNNIIGTIYIHAKINKFLPLLEKMDEHFIVPSNPAQHHCFKETMKSASFVTMMFLGSAMSTGFSYGIIPFTAYTNDTMAWPLPYQAALPFDTTQTSGYWAAYLILEISILTMCINGSLNCDFFVSVIIKTTCQFQFLQLMLANIQEEVIQKNNEKQRHKTKRERSTDLESAFSVLNLTINDNNTTTGLTGNEELTDEMELESEYVRRLSECVKYHQVMLQFVSDLENAASPFILFQMLIYVLFLCMNVLIMSSVPLLSSEFLTTLAFTTCSLSLVLLLCWYGNELRIQSLQVAEAAYDCGWLDTSSRFKRSLTMVMFRAQKPVKMSAWKFFDVDLGTFTTVLRATYSFYQVLHKVYSKEEE